MTTTPTALTMRFEPAGKRGRRGGDAASPDVALNEIVGHDALRRRLGDNALNSIGEWTMEKMVSGFRAAIEYACAR